MTSQEYEIQEWRPRRIGITLDTLKAIEAAVIFDINADGTFESLDAQRGRIGQAVAIYCALLAAESQK